MKPIARLAAQRWQPHHRLTLQDASDIFRRNAVILISFIGKSRMVLMDYESADRVRNTIFYENGTGFKTTLGRKTTMTTEPRFPSRHFLQSAVHISQIVLNKLSQLNYSFRSIRKILLNI